MRVRVELKCTNNWMSVVFFVDGECVENNRVDIELSRGRLDGH